MEKTNTIDGIRFKIEDIGETSYSVICLDPCFDDDGLDQTHWPDDSEVSEWAGRPVRCLDAGDNPDFPEAIYEIDED